jgi:hypothetical protein
MDEPVSMRQQTDREVFLRRANEARAEAAEATLENVRERCLRAEAAWMTMAARVERTEKMRAMQLAAKAAEQTAP